MRMQNSLNSPQRRQSYTLPLGGEHTYTLPLAGEHLRSHSDGQLHSQEAQLPHVFDHH
jgi:hypothetical protein